MSVASQARGSRPQPPTGTRATATSAAAVMLVGAAAVLALHVLRPDLAPASHRLSEYAVGPWGWLMTGVFLVIASGLWLLRRALPTTSRLRPVRALLAVASAGLVLSAAFRTDVTTPNAARELVHTVASGGALLSLVAAAAWTVTLGHDAIGWRRGRGPARGAVAIAALGAAVSPLAHDGPWTGVVQRLSYAALIAWLLLVCHAVATTAVVRGSDDDRSPHPRR